ncbi:MAG: phosphate acyltransferase [Gemmatimonadota bacterium]|nr:phosphate acyltransferase [Gemmatimonadota bacterium]MDH5804279.1 phosphate acyltransferase [Gemmatimonadota bacterium]
MTFRADLHEKARRLKRRVVFAEGTDDRVREAARKLESSGVAEVEVLDEKKPPHFNDAVDLLRRRKPNRFPDDASARKAMDHPAMIASAYVALGLADAAVAGATCPTADVVRAGLSLVGPAPGIKTVSSAFYMVFESRVLTFSDAGVVPDPSEEELAEIARAACRDRRRIVGDEPIVAFLSYSTHGSAAGPRVDKVRAALDIFRKAEPDVLADGELQGDAALVPEVAATKAPGSPIGGRANVLIFPDLDSGNIAYKLVQRLAGAGAIGPILQGLDKPVADLSRGATAEDIFDVAAVAILQSD